MGINYFQLHFSRANPTHLNLKKLHCFPPAWFHSCFLLSLCVSTAVESLHSLNDQISHFIVSKSKTLDEDEDAFLPSEKESLKSAMRLMRHLLMDAQVGNQYTNVC